MEKMLVENKTVSVDEKWGMNIETKRLYIIYILAFPVLKIWLYGYIILQRLKRVYYTY